MPQQSGLLRSHSRFFDFLSRITDILILAMTLQLMLLWDGREWGQTSTLLFLFALVYFQLTASLTGIYNSQRMTTLRQHVGDVLISVLGAFVLITMTAGLSNRLHSLADRVTLLEWLITSAIALCAWRIAIKLLLNQLRKQGYNSRLVGIAGCGTLARHVAQKINNNPWMGLRLAGLYDSPNGLNYVPSANDDQLVGDLQQLIEDARTGKLDHVYIALPLQDDARMRELIDELSDSAASVFIVPDVFMFELMNSRQTDIAGIPAISIYDTPFTFSDAVLKRGFDIFGSLGILSVIALPMLVIAAAIKLTSKGPVIFKQKRYGLDGKPIEVWKFRTMTTMDNGDVVRQATKNDSRLTPIGGLLRRTSLDELPQFINVLQGQMSIVGPRPHAIAHNEEYRKLIKGYMLRHKVKPGITGWAQINGWRGETDTLEKMEKRVEFDLAYIRNWNIWLDIKIVFLTVFKGFISKNAY